MFAFEVLTMLPIWLKWIFWPRLAKLKNDNEPAVGSRQAAVPTVETSGSRMFTRAEWSRWNWSRTSVDYVARCVHFQLNDNTFVSAVTESWKTGNSFLFSSQELTSKVTEIICARMQAVGQWSNASIPGWYSFHGAQAAVPRAQTRDLGKSGSSRWDNYWFIVSATGVRHSDIYINLNTNCILGSKGFTRPSIYAIISAHHIIIYFFNIFGHNTAQGELNT